VRAEETSSERRKLTAASRRGAPLPGAVAVACAIAALAAVLSGQTPALLSSIFQDHAVLQRERPITVWGAAAPGEQVSVALNGQQASVEADGSGRWKATLPAMGAGGPYTLEARAESGASQTVSDILIGDVWLCSGQSNMEFTVAPSRGGQLAVMRSANDRMRLLTVPHVDLVEPGKDLPAGAAWQVAAPQTVAKFSAACYFFARELQRSVQVPMGLINASWGGSAAEPWVGESGLRAAGLFGERLDLLRTYARDQDEANQRMGRMWEDWWRAHAPAGLEPWQPGSSGTGEWAPLPEPMRNWKTWGVPVLANHDGMVWYRRTVRLTAEQAARAATLSLGGIDEVDETWVNGRVIRNTFGWGTERNYTLPAGVLRPGENVIVVNVLSTWDAGGMVGPAEKLALAFDDGTKVPLAGEWRYQVVPLGIGRAPRAPWESVSGLTTLYNGMIAPLGPFGLRGAVWYQGETNADAPAGYQEVLAALMSSWRSQFGADLPFLVVQLPGFGPTPTAPMESNWADVRDAQRRAVASDAHAGLAVTIDIGERGDIHPINKLDVGIRLARAARHVVYGEAIAPSGPVARAVRLEPGRVVVTFGDVVGQLVTYSASQAIGFELCGAATASCRFASATVEADHVVIPTGGGPAPSRVRFCWGASPLCNLSDASGLPAGPFELVIR
jgi:sialate O-acetylesterase